MVELAGSIGAVAQIVDADRHRHVRVLTSYGRPFGQIEPLTAYLAERIGSSLRRCPGVSLGPQWRFGVEHCAQGGEQGLARLRIEVAIDPNHTQERH